MHNLKHEKEKSVGKKSHVRAEKVQTCQILHADQAHCRAFQFCYLSVLAQRSKKIMRLRCSRHIFSSSLLIVTPFFFGTSVCHNLFLLPVFNVGSLSSIYPCHFQQFSPSHSQDCSHSSVCLCLNLPPQWYRIFWRAVKSSCGSHGGKKHFGQK